LLLAHLDTVEGLLYVFYVHLLKFVYGGFGFIATFEEFSNVLLDSHHSLIPCHLFLRLLRHFTIIVEVEHIVQSAANLLFLGHLMAKIKDSGPNNFAKLLDRELIVVACIQSFEGLSQLVGINRTVLIFIYVEP